LRALITKQIVKMLSFDKQNCDNSLLRRSKRNAMQRKIARNVHKSNCQKVNAKDV